MEDKDDNNNSNELAIKVSSSNTPRPVQFEDLPIDVIFKIFHQVGEYGLDNFAKVSKGNGSVGKRI